MVHATYIASTLRLELGEPHNPCVIDLASCIVYVFKGQRSNLIGFAKENVFGREANTS